VYKSVLFVHFLKFKNGPGKPLFIPGLAGIVVIPPVYFHYLMIITDGLPLQKKSRGLKAQPADEFFSAYEASCFSRK
jgi:hypothetical protein